MFGERIESPVDHPIIIPSSALACCYEGKPTDSGAYLIDLLLANVCKQNVTRFPFEMGRLAQDWTLCREVFKGCRLSSHRMRVMRLIENMTLGSGAVGYLTESLHGAGSPQAQRIMIGRLGQFDKKKELAKNIAKIKE